jgi:hypothetical protein
LPKRRLVVALFALLAVVLVAAGCGGGGSSSSSTSGSDTTGGSTTESDSGGEAPTKATFIKEADKICTDDEDELNEEISAFAKEKGISTKTEPAKGLQIELFHNLVLPNIAKQAEELADLTPPEGDEATIEDLTDTLAKEVAEAKKAQGAAGTALQGATEKAQAYGLKTCGI